MYCVDYQYPETEGKRSLRIIMTNSDIELLPARHHFVYIFGKTNLHGNPIRYILISFPILQMKILRKWKLSHLPKINDQ